ncbi:MAG: metallophosphoesterase [Burkholderiales bacterium]
MKLQLLSDLHLERDPDFRPTPAPDADALVLAGDIGSYQRGSRLKDDTFGLAAFSPHRSTCPWKTVLYVPGNHEYDDLDFDETHARLQDVCERLGIVLLERSTVTLDGVRFIGTTLWTDFDALALGTRPVSSHPTADSPLTIRLRQREKAFRAANYYLSKNSTLRRGAPMLAQDIREFGLECQQWLRAALAEAHDGPTVVVTHFAPSLRSHDPRFGVTPGTAGFCNALDDLFPAARLWVHGHLHCRNDYFVAGDVDGHPFRCRVVANPLGYREKGEQQEFQPALVLEVPPA